MPQRLLTTRNDKKKLVESSNYKDFLKNVLDIFSTRLSRKFGYADLARKAGFASRSYPRDIILGNKPITLESMYKIANGLKLSMELTQFFYYLVERDNPTCRSKNKSDNSILRQLSNLKERILKEDDSPLQNDFQFKNYLIPTVFAALGKQIHGISLEIIKEKTDLSLPEIKQALHSLEQLGFATQKGNNYFPTAGHLSFNQLGEKTFFQSYFIHSLEKIKDKAQKDFSSAQYLFFNSTLSIDKANLPKLREELLQLLLKYVDEAENPDGQRIINLNCSLS